MTSNAHKNNLFLMNKKFFEIDPNKLDIRASELSNNYEYCVINYDQYSFDNIKLKNKDICILPFETDGSGENILSLFLMKYHDFPKNEVKTSTIIARMNEDLDEANLDTVYRMMTKIMQVPIKSMNLERVFYLGEIEMNIMLSGAMPCYAVNVTDLITKKENSFVIDENLSQILEKIAYQDILKCTTRDFLVTSSTFMLLSYFA